jgi:hypothetical protein
MLEALLPESRGNSKGGWNDSALYKKAIISTTARMVASLQYDNFILAAELPALPWLVL